MLPEGCRLQWRAAQTVQLQNRRVALTQTKSRRETTGSEESDIIPFCSFDIFDITTGILCSAPPWRDKSNRIGLGRYHKWRARLLRAAASADTVVAHWQGNNRCHLFRLNSRWLGGETLISWDLNYLDAQTEPSDRLPPDRYSPLLQLERRVQTDAEPVSGKLFQRVNEKSPSRKRWPMSNLNNLTTDVCLLSASFNRFRFYKHSPLFAYSCCEYSYRIFWYTDLHSLASLLGLPVPLLINTNIWSANHMAASLRIWACKNTHAEVQTGFLNITMSSLY